MRRFKRFATFDWSGARAERPAGIALAEADDGNEAPRLMAPPGGWSRMAVLDWLQDHAKAGSDILIAFDLSPSLPFIDRNAYFDGLAETPASAKALWRLVDTVCANDPHLGANAFLADARFRPFFRTQHRGDGRWIVETGARFGTGAGRMRRVETACTAQGLGNSASCFNAVGAAQVAKSSLTGMRLFNRLGGIIPIWPFDPVPARGPMIVEIYTTIAARHAGIGGGRSKVRDAETLDTALAAFDTRPHARLTGYDDHATDAILTTAWLRRAAPREGLWRPAGMSDHVARTEGWTFGVE